ncbi:MAG: hypothetical protein ABFD90_13415 [Phycisphaerales bacterium]
MSTAHARWNLAQGTVALLFGVGIVQHEGQYYVAALNEGALDGVRIAKLRWVGRQDDSL